MAKFGILLLTLSTLLVACNTQSNKTNTKEKPKDSLSVNKLSKEAQEVANYVNKNCVIAHRGSTYFAPEETEPAFRWARNIGADYLEFDVQMTKDSMLIAFHDKNLSRTTDVASIFPERKLAEINEFTLRELRSLDAGSNFNKQHPDRARDAYKGLKIMTLRDVIMIAEGYKIQYKNGEPVKELKDGQWTGQYLYEKDPKDNGNRPGVYIETKNPKPGVEKLLYDEITRLGWNTAKNPKQISTTEGNVAVANSKGRFVLQSFSKESLLTLEKLLPQVPKCLLLWQPNMKDDIKGNYQKAIDFCVANNIEIMGPSISGAPNNYKELTAPWMADLVHNANILMHPYTFDTEEQLDTYENWIEGVFTNRADLALTFYNRKSEKTPEEILVALGY